MMQNQPTLAERITMLQDLILDQTIPLECDTVVAVLGEYYLATLQQQHTQPKWSFIPEHLACCPACAEQYQWLQEEAEWESALDEIGPEQAPAPDLTFLQQRPTATTAPVAPSANPSPPPAWRRTLTGLLIDLGAALQQAVPYSRPAAAGLRHAPQTAGQPYQFTTPPNVTLGVTGVTVRFAALTNQPDLYELFVQIAGSAQPTFPVVGETEIILSIPGRAPEPQVVDSFGAAQFRVARADLALAQLEIIPDADS